MIETFDKEGNGRRWKLVVISQQQWQEADCNVFKLPRPWKTNQFLQIVMTLAFNKLNFNPQNSTHMFLLLMQYSRSSISCWYFLWICWTILLLYITSISCVKCKLKLCKVAQKNLFDIFYCQYELTEQTQCSSALASSDLLLHHPLTWQDPQDRDFH